MDSTVFKYPIASLMILCFLPEPTISEGLTYEEMNTLSKYEEILHGTTTAVEENK